MKRWISGLFAAWAALFALLFALPARAAFAPPELHGYIVDTAGKLGEDDLAYLDRKLDALRRRTGFDIAVFLPASLEGEDIDDIAYKTFNAWKLGQKGADNGVLLVIAPAERRVRIETGKGVGGALTDLQSNDIIRNVINPLLQQDRFRDAVDQGTTAIGRALIQGTPGGGTPPAPEARAPPSPLSIGVAVGFGILVLILAIVSPTFRQILFFFLFFGRGGGGGGGGGGIGRGGSSGGGGSSDSY